MTNTATVPALKEWSAVVHALLDGRQRVLLRKGGIGEKRFDVTAREFMLFPTVAHSHAERVRPEFRDLLAAAAPDSTDDRFVVRAAAKVVAALPVNRPDNITAIEDLHIWTAESVRRDRLDFRPKHRLAVLVVQTIPLLTPVELPRVPITPAARVGCSCLSVTRRWVCRCTTTRHCARSPSASATQLNSAMPHRFTESGRRAPRPRANRRSCPATWARRPR